MPLARASARTCLVWKNFGDRIATKGGRLWQAFYDCLDRLDEPEAADESFSVVEHRIREFLHKLLDEAHPADDAARGLDPLLTQERALLERERVSDTLRRWQGGKTVDGERRRPLVEKLYAEPLDRFAAYFYLGQLAFVLGHLQTAQDYAYRALRHLRQIHESGSSAAESLPLRILEFLALTLVLEVRSMAEGDDAVVDREGRPRRLLHRLSALAKQQELDILKDLVAGADKELLAQLAPRNDGGAEERTDLAHLRELVATLSPPTPISDEIERGLELTVDGDKAPLALAFELSRKNHAGMLLYKLCEWRSAAATFSAVLGRIEQQREQDAWHPALAPLEYEAKAYLGRLYTQGCDFERAEAELNEAFKHYRRARDFFAQVRIQRFQAEVDFRRLAWKEAESTYLDVLEESRRQGFEHDAAVAELALGKIYSRFGLQGRALELLEQALEHFKDLYDVPREIFDCIFWQAAAHARTLGPEGHAADEVARAKAQIRVYQRLHDRARQQPQRVKKAWRETLEQLKRATEAERHPALLETMLELRLGSLPDEAHTRIVAEWAEIFPEDGSWRLRAHALLCRHVLRLIDLQRGDKDSRWRFDADRTDEAELRKFRVRNLLVTTLENLAFADPGQPLELCRWAASTYRAHEDLGLRGGFVPSLVDTAQLFADRGAFVALVLLLRRALEEGLDQLMARGHEELAGEDLKTVHRSLTKYLVLEHNYHLGAPEFDGSRSPALWRELENRRRETGLHPWAESYREALLGGCGLSYPRDAVGLGWVEALDSAAVHLRIAWLEERRGEAEPFGEDAFERLEVPIRIALDGHADQRLDPVLLVGRDETGHRRRWVAHRLAAVDKEDLFERLDAAPWYRPRPQAWLQLWRRLTGREPARCRQPEVSEQTIVEHYRRYAREWFGGRLPKGLFGHLFGIEESSPDASSRHEAEPVETDPNELEPARVGELLEYEVADLFDRLVA